MENGAASEGRDPSGFLSEIIGAPVTVKLNSGVVYRGKTLAMPKNWKPLVNVFGQVNFSRLTGT